MRVRCSYEIGSEYEKNFDRQHDAPHCKIKRFAMPQNNFSLALRLSRFRAANEHRNANNSIFSSAESIFRLFAGNTWPPSTVANAFNQK